jgi:hypothetical protein
MLVVLSVSRGRERYTWRDTLGVIHFEHTLGGIHLEGYTIGKRGRGSLGVIHLEGYIYVYVYRV